MAFHLGSLGFLSPYEFLDYQEKVNDVLQGVYSIYTHIYAHTRMAENGLL